VEGLSNQKIDVREQEGSEKGVPVEYGLLCWYWPPGTAAAPHRPYGVYAPKVTTPTERPWWET
jgi:hypothetical protein